jgi:hypothetical protein
VPGQRHAVPGGAASSGEGESLVYVTTISVKCVRATARTPWWLPATLEIPKDRQVDAPQFAQQSYTRRVIRASAL